MIIIGIDEAGRGPVLGPLVMCAVAFSKKDEEKLRELNIKDSKMLSKERREKLFPIIKSIAKSIKIKIISPQEIDKAVNSINNNLNFLEAKNACEMINEISNEIKIDSAIVDCPSPNTKSYAEFMMRYIKDNSIKIICEHKADQNHIIVSAASVIAKVSRDNEIEKIKKEFGIDIGSGYMSDPKTQEFLKNNFDKYDFFRKSWMSFKLADDERKQKKLGDF